MALAVVLAPLQDSKQPLAVHSLAVAAAVNVVRSARGPVPRGHLTKGHLGRPRQPGEAPRVSIHVQLCKLAVLVSAAAAVVNCNRVAIPTPQLLPHLRTRLIAVAEEQAAAASPPLLVLLGE